jgi:hypothetical protein
MSALLGGILPFGACFVELFFVMSRWVKATGLWVYIVVRRVDDTLQRASRSGVVMME